MIKKGMIKYDSGVNHLPPYHNLQKNKKNIGYGRGVTWFF